MSFLREKNEQAQERQKQELELRKQQLEVESKKQDNFMQMMLNQQQQQQRQMQDFQALMSIQTKQQKDLMLALVSKLVEKNKICNHHVVIEKGSGGSTNKIWVYKLNF